MSSSRSLARHAIMDVPDCMEDMTFTGHASCEDTSTCFQPSRVVCVETLIVLYLGGWGTVLCQLPLTSLFVKTS